MFVPCRLFDRRFLALASKWYALRDLAHMQPGATAGGASHHKQVKPPEVVAAEEAAARKIQVRDAGDGDR